MHVCNGVTRIRRFSLIFIRTPHFFFNSHKIRLQKLREAKERIFQEHYRQEALKVAALIKAETSGTGEEEQPSCSDDPVVGSPQPAEDEGIEREDGQEDTACAAPQEGTTSAEKTNSPSSVDAEGYSDNETQQEYSQASEVQSIVQPEVSRVIKVSIIAK